jgi:branched-chain amino acid transport system ATP-binding protein
MSAPDLSVRDLHAYYGGMHILQGVTFAVTGEPLIVVGRNGMGKSTLCKALMGLVTTGGGMSFATQDMTKLASHERARLGIGYVPQGRRVFPSLTVEEHLRLLGRRAVWDADRVYALFPRLAERRKQHGLSLSGGEQQMLAIGRALLSGPTLLVMDEPTEGLAPIVVETVITALRELSRQGMRLLVVEQDLHVATSLSRQVSVMVNGRIETTIESERILADEELKARFLGLH